MPFSILKASRLNKTVLLLKNFRDALQRHWLFLFPMPGNNLADKQKRSLSWLIRNYHMLPGISGEIPYTNFRTILNSIVRSYSAVFVKGQEKRKFLEKLTGHIFLNLEDWHCPKFDVLPFHEIFCPVHPINFKHCALMKASSFESYINRCHRDHSVYSSRMCFAVITIAQ